MKIINKKQLSITQDGASFTLERQYSAAYGFGEKFDSVNQKGKFVRACVREKCFYQGEYTYYSMPFMVTPDGFGIYVDSYAEVDFDLRISDKIVVSCLRGTNGELPEIYLFEGTPKEIIGQFRSLVGMPRLFPKWVLGGWMSSNRWNCQSDIEEQVKLTAKYGIPHNVLVIEPWSDLTTHYLWNGSKMPHKNGDQFGTLAEMDFSESEQWQNPKAMIDSLHKKGIKVLLWVVPIYAQGVNIEGDCNLEQCYSDNEYVKQTKQCVLNADGTPYLIPHTWCVESMIPDFTDPVGTKNWFNRFSYLLEMGIDGFKTDGGEFVHVKDVRFKNGTSGIEGQNEYCEQYTKAFADFVGNERIVFSRAGGPKSPTFSVMWAGDQESTWSEFASTVKAGISAGISGTSCWGFDISGFSGYLPSKNLYLRALQTAAFLPVMQWHSDPVSNKRCDFTGAWKINDRSPWNMADYYQSPELLKIAKKQFLLHYNLLPYIYNLTVEASVNGIAPVRHLALEFPDDKACYDIDDQFMLGDALLIAPVLQDYVSHRNVYLPENSEWFDFYSGKSFGGGTHSVKLTRDRTPTFMRKNTCVALNLHGEKLFSDVGNRLDGYDTLTFVINGSGIYNFADDLGDEITIQWSKNEYTIVKNIKNTPVNVVRLGEQKLI